MLKQSYHLRSLGHLSILPPEIRNIVYRFVLVDPPKWERPHKRCRHGLSNGYLAHICQLPFEERSSCRGRVRGGIGLLRVNKALHTEASPIFWSQNTFCFLSGDEFTECVGTCLRSDYRSLLRHIYIIGHIHYTGKPSSSFTPQWRDWDPDYEKKPFEIALRQCTGLRTLGIDIDAVTPLQYEPAYLDIKYVQLLAGMISPKVQFSFLKLGVMVALDLAVKPGIHSNRSIRYRSLSRMPYDLHDEAVTGPRAATEKGLPMRDWELVYEARCLSPYIIPFSQILEIYGRSTSL